MTTRRPSRTPEEAGRPTAATPFDLERYMPSPEAYQEAADDAAAEELMQRCFDRPEVKAVQEDLRAADEEERRAAEAMRAAVAPPLGAPAEEEPRRRWSLATSVLLATLAVLTPAVLVWLLAARPKGVNPPEAPAPSASLVPPTPPVAPPSASPPVPEVPTSASVADPLPPPVVAPKATGVRPPKPPASVAPPANSAPAAPTSSAPPKVID
jgi:hypothetical protein